MRYLALLLLLMGCGPVCAAPPKNETIVQALERYDALSVKRDEAMAAKVDGLAETVGNATAELEAVKEELRGLKSLLTVDAEPAVPVPPAQKPVQVDAPPVSSGDSRRVAVNGKPIDVQATIKTSYRRMWSFPGSIDSHLTEHGVTGFQGLDYETKRKLHSALHEQGLKPVASKPPIVMNAAVVVPRSNCPGGVCPNVRQYGYQQRRGLFGRWR